jgi:hypothetical protein
VTKKKSPETANNRPARGSSGGVACPRGSSSRLLAQGSFGATTCRRGSTTHLPAQGSSGGAACPRGSGSHLPAQGSSRAATCRLDPSTRLLAQGSSGSAACPRGSELDENRRVEQLRKQIEPSAVFDPIATGTTATKESARLSAMKRQRRVLGLVAGHCQRQVGASQGQQLVVVRRPGWSSEDEDEDRCGRPMRLGSTSS